MALLECSHHFRFCCFGWAVSLISVSLCSVWRCVTLWVCAGVVHPLLVTEWLWVFFRFDWRQQLPTSSFLGEGAPELRGGERACSLCYVRSHFKMGSLKNVRFFGHVQIFDRNFTLRTKLDVLFVALQQCKIYLCGTKNDLVTVDRSLRQVDYHDAQDFAEGNYSPHWSLTR